MLARGPLLGFGRKADNVFAGTACVMHRRVVERHGRVAQRVAGRQTERPEVERCRDQCAITSTGRQGERHASDGRGAVAPDFQQETRQAVIVASGDDQRERHRWRRDGIDPGNRHLDDRRTIRDEANSKRRQLALQRATLRRRCTQVPGAGALRNEIPLEGCTADYQRVGVHRPVEPRRRERRRGAPRNREASSFRKDQRVTARRQRFGIEGEVCGIVRNNGERAEERGETNTDGHLR